MNICLFGAASDEIGKEYLEAAEAFGEALAGGATAWSSAAGPPA